MFKLRFCGIVLLLPLCNCAMISCCWGSLLRLLIVSPARTDLIEMLWWSKFVETRGFKTFGPSVSEVRGWMERNFAAKTFTTSSFAKNILQQCNKRKILKVDRATVTIATWIWCALVCFGVLESLRFCWGITISTRWIGSTQSFSGSQLLVAAPKWSRPSRKKHRPAKWDTAAILSESKIQIRHDLTDKRDHRNPHLYLVWLGINCQHIELASRLITWQPGKASGTWYYCV